VTTVLYYGDGIASYKQVTMAFSQLYTHTRLTALFPGLPG